MLWSHLDYSAAPDADESFNQMCGRNGLDVGWDGKSVMVDRNGMVEISGADPNWSDVARKECIVDRNQSIVEPTVSDVRCSRRDGDRTVIVRSDVRHSTFQLARLSRTKFA